MQDFQKRIGSIVYVKITQEYFVEGKFLIFVEVTFNDSSEIGVWGLT